MSFVRSYQVRGHLAAQIDPLGLNNMNPEEAKKMIIRSVTVEEKVGDQFDENFFSICTSALPYMWRFQAMLAWKL